MTGLTLYSYFSGAQVVFGIKTQTIQNIYGFLIGSVFAGVIGTGFYPIFGNRVWCRFGCPLAAYLGLVQRLNLDLELQQTEGNVFPVEIVQPIVKWELMFVPMLKKGRILFVLPVWVVVFVLQFVQEEF